MTRARKELELRLADQAAEQTRSSEGLTRETTAGKLAEARLQQNGEHLSEAEQWRDVFEINPAIYFMVGADGTIVAVNSFGAEQLGYTVNELVGQPVLMVFSEVDRDAAQRSLSVCLKQLGKSMSWEFRKVPLSKRSQ
jgi:PAS domain S-box-containing protein